MNMHEFAPKIELMRSMGGELMSEEDSSVSLVEYKLIVKCEFENVIR